MLSFAHIRGRHIRKGRKAPSRDIASCEAIPVKENLQTKIPKGIRMRWSYALDTHLRP